MSDSETPELTPEDLENIEKIIEAEKNKKKKSTEKFSFTEEEIEKIKLFGKYFDFLEVEQKNFIRSALSEIHESIKEQDWTTKNEKNIECFLEAFQILCPDGFSHEIKLFDDNPEIKHLFVKYEPEKLFFKFIKTFH